MKLKWIGMILFFASPVSFAQTLLECRCASPKCGDSNNVVSIELSEGNRFFVLNSAEIVRAGATSYVYFKKTGETILNLGSTLLKMDSNRNVTFNDHWPCKKIN